MTDPITIGKLLRQAREAQGLSLERLARDLNLHESVLRSLEADVYEQLPTGSERPLARQVAERLGVDPEAQGEAWEALPGGLSEETADPQRERLERAVMGTLTVGSILLMAWLVVPGPNLKTGALNDKRATRPGTRVLNELPPPRPPQNQPYPVLGEVVPEAPQNSQGLLVSLKSQDACAAHIVADGFDEKRVLQVSEPWQARVKGAFTITLDNAGVVSLEVAGRIIHHGQSVGESWTGHFGPEGQWLRPKPPEEPPPTTPELDPDAAPEQ